MGRKGLNRDIVFDDVAVKIPKNGLSLRRFCIELKLCTVVTVITKFHDMSTVAFPWQQNGLEALSIQN